MNISPSAGIFMTLLAGLSAVALFYKSPEKEPITTEGFNVNQPKMPPKAAITNSGPQPAPEGPLPGAPYGSISNSSPLPYKNPVLEKASLFQINSLIEDLRAFIGFDAKQLEDRSDPSIQLPLVRAKADFRRLKDEFHVLSSTPGIQSQLTQQNIVEIRSNLRYLQREARTIEANTTEGFTDSDNSGPRASRDELNELVIKIYAEMQRLSASGTSDPIIQARLTSLTNMRLDVQSILQKLDSGDMKPQDIPIYKSDIQNALPLLQNINDPIPNILHKAGLSPVLANLLPVKAGSKESDYLAQNQDALNSALDKLVKGLTWTANNSQRSNDRPTDNIYEKFDPNDQSLFSTGFPSISEMTATANPGGTIFSPTGSRKNKYTMNLEDQRMDALSATKPSDPGHFDWRQRAKNIRESIRSRGLSPSDFGCLTPEQENSVSPTFSWRGYSKMVCNRLGTTMDPGLPEVCGCPPEGWLGWSQ